MIFNLLNSLTDPDNTPDGYINDLSIKGNGWVVVGILLIIIIALCITIFAILKTKRDKTKELDKTKKSNLDPAELSEEEKQTLTEFRQLTAEEKQIIDDTIKTFNRSKKE